MTIGCHVGWHVPLTRGKKWKKQMMPPSTIFPSFNKIFNNKVFMAYWHWKIMFSTKMLKQTWKWVDCFVLYPFHSSPTILYKKSHITSLLKYISHFSYYMTCMAEMYSSPTKSSSFVEFFWRKLIKLNSKLLKSPQSLQYCHQVWCTHLVKILKCKK
jgi:hypothetical protein